MSVVLDYGHWRGKMEIPAMTLVLIFMGCSIRSRAGAAAVGREQPAADLGLDLHGDFPSIYVFTNVSGRVIRPPEISRRRAECRGSVGFRP